MIIGHRAVTAMLERHLPPVTLLCGPPSVGKWTLTQHLADHHRIAPVDRSAWPDGLGVDNARTVKAFLATAPMGTVKLVQARLDQSSNTALNALLKILEEPPGGARFLLTASRPLPATITSRAQIFHLGLLCDTEVADILIARGQPPAVAHRNARFGRGRVDRALNADAMLSARNTALTVVRAIAAGDRELFDRAFATFDEEAATLLRAWVGEALTGQWCWFTADDTFGLRRDPRRLRHMLLAVHAYPAARPQLGLRAALHALLPD